MWLFDKFSNQLLLLTSKNPYHWFVSVKCLISRREMYVFLKKLYSANKKCITPKEEPSAKAITTVNKH